MKAKLRKIHRLIKMFIIRKRYHLKNVDKTFYMAGNSSISSDLVAGEFSYIGPRAKIYPKVKIGAYTMLANDVSIIGGDHAFDKVGLPIIFSGRGVLEETIIGKDVWIGAYTKILTGVTIGDGVIVGMGSVVTKDLEEYSVYGGVPARKIKDRFKSQKEINEHKEMLSKSAKIAGFNLEMLCS